MVDHDICCLRPAAVHNDLVQKASIAVLIFGILNNQELLATANKTDVPVL
jgi:hypothetical protein